MAPSSHYQKRDYEFANTFVTLRTTIELTQQSLATRLGISRRAVENWEQGLTTPQAKHLKAFLALCVRFSAFAAGHEEEQIRAFWKAACQKVLLDEYWLTDLLSQPSSSPTEGTGKPSPDSEQASAAPSQELALWTVPYTRNPHFTGRDELLSELEDKLAPRATDQPSTIHQAALTQSQAIKGLGGIGKTQTAIEYAYRAREQGRYTHTLWISSASEEAVLASFAALKDRVPDLGKEEESDQRVLVKKALRWLERRPEPWLLIYDNADEITFLPPYLPKEGRGSILFTTRASAVSALAPALDVDTLPLEEGIQLLLRRAGRVGDVTAQEREEARTLVLALGQFPLAIDQAGAYLEETECTLADYLHIYEQHQYELLARRGKQVTGYPDAVATTWSLAFERIEERNPAAAELLRLCAFVAPDQLPEELITEGAPFWPAALQEAVRDPWRFNQMLATLLDFSLIKRVGRERILSLHRLVQVVQQARMTPQEQRQWTQRLVFSVQAIFPHEPYELATRQRCERLLQQALACETLIEQHQLQQAEAADLLHRTGNYLREHGFYLQAEPLLRRALFMREQLLGPDHLDVATSLYDLGRTIGNNAQVESFYLRALHIREQQLGPEHLEVAKVLNWLAIVYEEEGKYAQAESLYQRALGMREQQLGPEHLEVAEILGNLGFLYSTQRKNEQAELPLLRALRIQEEHLGPEHHEVAASLNFLGYLYSNQGKDEQAESFYQRALHIREQYRGPEHHEVAASLNNLGSLYNNQGKYAQAEPLLRRALRIWEEHLGPEHLHVAFALNNLAVTYTHQGRYEQADSLYQRALHMREQQLGPEHLETAKVLQNFAGSQQAQGRTQEAVIMYQRALTMREHILGSDHPLTLEIRTRLQEVLATRGLVPETMPTKT